MEYGAPCTCHSIQRQNPVVLQSTVPILKWVTRSVMGTAADGRKGITMEVVPLRVTLKSKPECTGTNDVKAHTGTN